MEVLVYWTFGVAAAGAATLHWRTRSAGSDKPRNGDLNALQRKYFAAYFPALFSDWLQGPYVYEVYRNYGFAEFEISILYLIGFASSMAFGTFTGPLADNFGRRRMCVAYCVLYGVCCLTKLSPSFAILAVGRVCGGIATSLLFSAFESWYVYEHKLASKLPADLIPFTFSSATFWNGILAIGAGIVANVFAETYDLGPVSPFMVALPFLFLSGVVIYSTWGENYGEPGEASWVGSCGEGVYKIFGDPNILLLGVVQSLFESVMYIFVFMWTPVLMVASPPLGLVFAVFMVCVMIGSSIFSIFFSDGLVNSSRALQVAGACAFVSMACCSLVQSSIFGTHSTSVIYTVSYLMFLVLEISVGIYFPAVGTMRSHVVPESHRAGIMNWFRVPLNLITCIGLINAKNSNAQLVFMACTFLTLLCYVSARSLHRRLFTNGNEKQILVENVADPEK